LYEKESLSSNETDAENDPWWNIKITITKTIWNLLIYITANNKNILDKLRP